jgi:hypothetical protein
MLSSHIQEPQELKSWFQADIWINKLLEEINIHKVEQKISKKKVCKNKIKNTVRKQKNAECKTKKNKE